MRRDMRTVALEQGMSGQHRGETKDWLSHCAVHPVHLQGFLQLWQWTHCTCAPLKPLHVTGLTRNRVIPWLMAYKRRSPSLRNVYAVPSTQAYTYTYMQWWQPPNTTQHSHYKTVATMRQTLCLPVTCKQFAQETCVHQELMPACEACWPSSKWPHPPP